MREKYKTFKKICKHCGIETYGTRARNFCSNSCRVLSKYKNVTHETKCLICGNIFETRYSYKLYCSEECRYKAALKRKPNTDRKCEYCFKEFTPTILLRRFCSEDCKIDKNKSIPKSYVLKCYRCGENFTGSQHNAKYCSTLCRNKIKNKKKNNKKNNKNKYCECCSFDIVEALHYHHINRTLGLGGITLCANCHYIFHSIAGNTSKKYERNSKDEVIQIINNRILA